MVSIHVDISFYTEFIVYAIYCSINYEYPFLFTIYTNNRDE